MWIASADAARLCDVTVSWFHRFAKHALGVQGDRVGRDTRWGGRHVLGAMLTTTLQQRFGVSAEQALPAGKSVVALPSDEVVEAMLGNGRCHVVAAGANVLPALYTEDEVKELGATVWSKLTAMGVRIRSLDLRELWSEVRAAARQDTIAECESVAG